MIVFWPFLFLFVFLALPAIAQNGAVEKALPIHTECPHKLPSERGENTDWTWSAHEKWAWEEICLGRPADMRYSTGVIDGEVCNPSDIEASGKLVPESRVLRPEFLGVIVNSPPWDTAPARPQLHIHCADFRKTLDISNQVVAAELRIVDSLLRSGAILREARFQRNLVFQGSYLAGVLSADGLQVGGDVQVNAGAQLNAIRLARAKIGGDLEVRDSIVTGEVLAERLEVGGAVFVDRSSFASVSLDDARIGDNFRIVGSGVELTQNMDGAQIGGDFVLRETYFRNAGLRNLHIGGQFELWAPTNIGGTWDLSGTRVDGSASLIGAALPEGMSATDLLIGGDLLVEGVSASYFDLEGATVAGNITLNGSTRVQERLDLSSAQIGGDLEVLDVRIDGQLDLHASRVVGSILVDNASLFELDLSRARIAGDLRSQELSLTGDTDLTAIEVEGDVSLRHAQLSSSFYAPFASFGGTLDLSNASVSELNLEKAQIAENVLANGLTVFSNAKLNSVLVGGELNFSDANMLDVDVRQSRVGGLLDLSGTRLNKVDVSAAVMDRLRLFNYENESLQNDPKWGKFPSLDLTNARTGTLDARIESWRNADGWIKSDLTGFRYSSLDSSARGLATTLADSEAKELVEWLHAVAPESRKDDLRADWFDQLANALVSTGERSKAREVKYAKLRHRDDTAEGDIWWLWPRKYFLWPAQRMLLGYGLYPYWFLFPLGGGIVIGGLIAWVSSVNPFRESVVRSLYFSIDMALPMIELNEQHSEIKFSPRWISGYFTALKVLGWLVTLALTGSLAFLYAEGV